MTYIGSLGVKVEKTQDGKFAVLINDQQIAAFGTEEEADRKAQTEADRLEGF